MQSYLSKYIIDDLCDLVIQYKGFDSISNLIGIITAKNPVRIFVNNNEIHIVDRYPFNNTLLICDMDLNIKNRININSISGICTDNDYIYTTSFEDISINIYYKYDIINTIYLDKIMRFFNRRYEESYIYSDNDTLYIRISFDLYRISKMNMKHIGHCYSFCIDSKYIYLLTHLGIEYMEKRTLNKQNIKLQNQKFWSTPTKLLTNKTHIICIQSKKIILIDKQTKIVTNYDIQDEIIDSHIYNNELYTITKNKQIRIFL